MFLVCNVPEYLNMALHFSTPVLAAAVWSRVTCPGSPQRGSVEN